MVINPNSMSLYASYLLMMLISLPKIHFISRISPVAPAGVESHLGKQKDMEEDVRVFYTRLARGGLGACMPVAPAGVESHLGKQKDMEEDVRVFYTRLARGVWAHAPPGKF